MSTEVLIPGRVAVVSGAGSGIGAALARALASRRLKVALADIDGERIEALAGELRGTGADVVPVRTDVADFAAVEAAARTIMDRWGPVHLLINNAGIETTGLIWELPPQRWATTIGVNLDGVFHGVRAFVPGMIAAGEPAHVVNLSSVGGLAIAAYQIPYVATKHAVLAFSESLHLELATEKIPIGVSVVLPGPVATDIFTRAVSADTDGPGERHRNEMRGLLDAYGMPPAEVAEQILAGVAADELWIHTHPEFSDAAITTRMQGLLARRPLEHP